MKKSKKVAVIGARVSSGTTGLKATQRLLGDDSHLVDYTVREARRLASILKDDQALEITREISPEREAEVRAKFKRFEEIRKAQAFYPDFPPYQNIDIPKGCTLWRITLTNDNWVFLGKRYVVTFQFEIAFSTTRGREKKIESMKKKMTALLKLSSHTDLHFTPGFTVEEWKEAGSA